MATTMKLIYSGHNYLKIGTDELKIYQSTGQSDLKPRGSVAYNVKKPVSPFPGDLYIFSSEGINTWEGSNNIQVSDQIWWYGTSWQLIQVNVAPANETPSETNAETDDLKDVTPLKLKDYVDIIQDARVYFASGVTLVADTPLTVNHALGLQHRNAFTWNFMSNNSSADVGCDSIDANNVSITSNVAVTGDITIVGF